MLKRLYISNFALIGEMNVVFPGGLTVITGETGAGKSIFLEALGLALGNRADLSTLKDKNKKCIVEAEFDVSAQNFKSFFKEHDLDEDHHLVLRREISVDGKSRSLINDSVVTLNIIKQISENLIDIHSQHQTLFLNESKFQLELLDAFANSSTVFEEYKKRFKEYQSQQIQLNHLLEKETIAKKETDYYQFLFNEFEQVEIKEGAIELLETESSAIENAEQIKSKLNAANLILSGGESNLLSGLNQVKQLLNSVSKYNQSYAVFGERVNTVIIELKDLISEFEKEEGSVFFDADRLAQINSQMDALNRLMNKHQAKSEANLIEIKKEIEKKLLGFNSIEEQIQESKKKLETSRLVCIDLANKLSKLRRAAISTIDSKVKHMLTSLAMLNAEFRIELLDEKELNMNGMNSIKFLFSANKGIALNELSKVASGGELSRLMLTLKSLLATKKRLPTIIFDEIDTGVSGDIANKIGNILFEMGATMQVVSITHLPQMASKGHHHLFVFKNEEGDKTNSFIKELKGEERIKEIAKMLSAGTPTKSAIINATELLSLN